MPYTQLTSEERYVIYHLRIFGLSYREIGRRLNRHHTTIVREVVRNKPTYFGSVYWHEWAQTQYCVEKLNSCAAHITIRSRI